MHCLATVSRCYLALGEYGKVAPTHHTRRWRVTAAGRKAKTHKKMFRVTESSRSKTKPDPRSDFQSWFSARLWLLQEVESEN